MWNEDELAFDMLADMTSDPIITVNVRTADGTLTFMAEPEEQDNKLILRRMHVQGAHGNAIGAANLMVLAQFVMERMGYDELVIEGAVRTTGANPGHRPRVLRFSRRYRTTPPAALR